MYTCVRVCVCRQVLPALQQLGPIATAEEVAAAQLEALLRGWTCRLRRELPPRLRPAPAASQAGTAGGAGAAGAGSTGEAGAGEEAEADADVVVVEELDAAEADPATGRRRFQQPLESLWLGLKVRRGGAGRGGAGGAGRGGAGGSGGGGLIIASQHPETRGTGQDRTGGSWCALWRRPGAGAADGCVSSG